MYAQSEISEEAMLKTSVIVHWIDTELNCMTQGEKLIAVCVIQTQEDVFWKKCTWHRMREVSVLKEMAFREI